MGRAPLGDSYGQILNTLQERLYDILKTVDGTPDDAWVQLVLEQQSFISLVPKSRSKKSLAIRN